MKKRKIVVFLAIIFIIAVLVPVLAAVTGEKEVEEKCETRLITVWQIDGFEGGRGSRKQYLQNIADKCFKDEKTYFTVTALEAQAARDNIKNGIIPDAISYPAGFYGIEELINKTYFPYINWCYGSYCLISLDETADFSDLNSNNTVLNAGKDNLSKAAATVCGLNGAAEEEPVNAYLKLIGGKYKYLFGTQRDVFRFKTRNVNINLKPVTQFNDLYQCFSILTKDRSKAEICLKFTDFLKTQKNYDGIGLFKENCATEIPELEKLNNLTFDSVINYPCTKAYIDEIKSAAESNDANKIKNLLK